MVQEHPKQIARIGAVIALVGSLIAIQWPIDFANLNIPAVLLFIAALVTWIGVEVADLHRIADPSAGDQKAAALMTEDVNKINHLMTLIDRNQYYVVKNFAVETYFWDSIYDGILKLNRYYEDDLFPFHNGKIQEKYIQLVNEAKDFHHDLYLLYTSDGKGRSTWRTRDDRWVPDDVYNRVMEKVAALNKQTTNIADFWEQLIEVARQELKGAPKSITRYEMSPDNM